MFSVDLPIVIPGYVPDPSIPNPGKLDPMLISVNHFCVKISYQPQQITYKMIVYVTKYRKSGQNDWKSMPETSNLSETVTGLDENTIYEITVSARYEEEVGWGPPSNPLRVKTERFSLGKCCLCVLEVLIIIVIFIFQE